MEFASYGYASCSGWSSLVVYVARSVGIPARQVVLLLRDNILTNC